MSVDRYGIFEFMVIYKNKKTRLHLVLKSRHIVTARKQSLRRLCFHRCLSVHGGDMRGRGVCMMGEHVWRGGGMHGREEV